jgi:hypothetical protein
MAESELIITFMLSLSLLLVVISAVRRYPLNFIIPGVTILMLLGAILPLVPVIGFETEEFYNFIQGYPFPVEIPCGYFGEVVLLGDSFG